MKRRTRVISMAILLGLAACAARLREIVVPLEARTRHSHSVAIVGETFYVVGGFAEGKASDPDRGTRDVFASDLESGVVRECAKLRDGIAAGAVCVVDGVLHAVGGGVVSRYDAQEDAWTVLTEAAAVPNSHLSATVHDGAIVIVGGFPFRDSVVLRFAPVDGSITALPQPPDMQKGDHFVFCASLLGRLHLLGGIRESDIFDRHWVLEDGTWRAAAPLPSPAFSKFAAHAVVADRLYVWDGGALAHVYDPATDGWTKVAGWPEVLAMPACVLSGSRIHVIGGLGLEENRIAGHRWFDVDSGVWSTVPDSS